jgi:hypothetical protein
LDGGLGTDIINGASTGTSKDTISDSTKVINTSFTVDSDALLAELLKLDANSHQPTTVSVIVMNSSKTIYWSSATL